MTIAVKRIKSSLKIQTRYCTFHIMQILKQIVFVISLTLISFYGLGQNTNSQTIEIVLVDEYIGFPEGGNGFVDIRSNDEGLNDIFDSYSRIKQDIKKLIKILGQNTSSDLSKISVWQALTSYKYRYSSWNAIIICFIR